MSDPDTTVAHEVLRFVVPSGQKKIRLDLYLAHHVENATRNKVQQAITQGRVLVNGKSIKSSYIVMPADTIQVTLTRPPRIEAQAEAIPLAIVFEDDELLVVNKPAGMVTHPAYGNYTGTLVNALLHHSNQLSGVNKELRPGIVHRLDKDTSGLLVVAKTDHAHSFLAAQFVRRTIEREYWALVWGRFKQNNGVIEAKLGRSKKDRRKVAVTSEGKTASTEYWVIKEFDFLTLLRLKLHTGRTHQIRVHLAHIGHPVFGDATYGGRNNEWGGLDRKKSHRAANLLKIIPRQALHAKTIGFKHPVSKGTMSFDSDLPEDFTKLLKDLSK
jgi:23S rRNA pseudouridine1911/1915/1917 synthase